MDWTDCTDGERGKKPLKRLSPCPSVSSPYPIVGTCESGCGVG